MSFSYREIQMVKGMLERGDKQHDIAAYFGLNGGRIAEVSTGTCDYPNAPAMSEDKLPPPGPYVGAKTAFEIKQILAQIREAVQQLPDGVDTRPLVELLKSAEKKF